MFTCKTCGIEKPVEEFYKQKTGKLGHHLSCKSCVKERSRNWAIANPERSKETVLRWVAANPDRRKEISQAWTDRNPGLGADRVAQWLIDNPERKQEWVLSNPEKVKMYRRNDRINRKWRKGKDTIKTSQWLEVVEFYNNTCLMCDRGEPVTLDHVVPLAVGGRHIIENSQPLCRFCNSHKRTKVIDLRSADQPYYANTILLYNWDKEIS